ncbi:MAG: nicotinamide-nucleotide amidohydrolase family protein [Leptospiraceae bacterium]|nr:nicotinamide-nucleotide amidohydrolase family protein [Leptospiraceae bacterium]
MPERGIRICIIGTEVTNGFIQDTNTKFFAEELYSRGLILKECRVIPDDPEIIFDTWNEYIRSGDLIINSGGLGPTDDDLTVDLISQLLGVEPVYDEEAEKRVKWFFKKRARSGVSLELALRQARIPAMTIGLKNTVGLAPGIWAPRINMIALPGFPVEIKSIWPEALKIIETQDLTRRSTRILPVWAMGESQLFSQIPRSNDVEIGVHALPIGCRLFLRAKNEDGNLTELDRIENEIRLHFTSLISHDPLRDIIEKLLADAKTLSTAESCTGGLIGKLITDIPGSSAWYQGGAITYSNSSKSQLLNVKEETIQRFGAVSHATAAEMAIGALAAFNSDIAVSTTGIAGPDGGSDEKPVGTAFAAIADKNSQKVYTAKLYYPFGRERFRLAVAHSLFLGLFQRFTLFDKNPQDWQTDRFGKNFVWDDFSTFQ